MHDGLALWYYVCSTDPPRSESTPESLEGRKAMFSYVLTLLRGQHQEQGGVLPAIDVAGLEHLAWCVDALFYLLQVNHVVLIVPSTVTAAQVLDTHSSMSLTWCCLLRNGYATIHSSVP